MQPTVLVPIRVLEGESIPDGVPELLTNAHVVLLGYHEIPDQTAAEQARMQFEDRATRKLETFEDKIEAAGATVERRLVFTHEGQKTIHRVTREQDCHAVLVPNATTPPEDVLVAVRGTVGIDRLGQVVAGLFASTDVGVTLYHVTDEGETDADVRTLLDALADRLVEHGMAESAIDVRIERDGSPLDSIVEAAEEYDAVVMGESDPSLTTFVFGMPADQVADSFLGPVIVVRSEDPPEQE